MDNLIGFDSFLFKQKPDKIKRNFLPPIYTPKLTFLFFFFLSNPLQCRERSFTEPNSKYFFFETTYYREYISWLETLQVRYLYKNSFFSSSTFNLFWFVCEELQENEDQPFKTFINVNHSKNTAKFHVISRKMFVRIEQQLGFLLGKMYFSSW